MYATTVLPPNYRPRGTLDLSADKRLLIGLNFGALLLLPVAGWLLYRAFVLVQPATRGALAIERFVAVSRGGVAITVPASWVIAILGAPFIVEVAHEAVHGLFFWIFSRRRPIFGVRGMYAFAALPRDCYLPRNPYVVVALAPLVLLSLLGLLLLPMLPPAAIPTLWLVLTANAVGAVGDLVVAGWLLTFPRTVLAQDAGDRMSLYALSNQEDDYDSSSL